MPRKKSGSVAIIDASSGVSVPAERSSSPALQAAVLAIQKKYGKGAIQTGRDIEPVSRVETGILALDLACGARNGIPGIPRSRIVVFVGEWSSAKSLVLQLLMAEFQRLGEDAFLNDVEHTFETTWGAQLGMDVESLLIGTPETAQEAINTTTEILNVMDGGGIVGVDSIAALTPKEEIKASADEWQQGLGARLINKAFRVWQSRLNRVSREGGTPATVVLIQQLRQKIGQFAGYTKPGGMAQEFFPSLTVQFWRGKDIYHVPGKGRAQPTEDKDRDAILDAGGCLVGRVVHFEIVKSKVCPPHVFGEFEIYLCHYRDAVLDVQYRPGQTNLGEQLVRAALREGLVQRAGAWYSAGDVRLGQGEENAARTLERNPEAFRILRAQVIERVEARLYGGA